MADMRGKMKKFWMKSMEDISFLIIKKMKQELILYI